MADARVSAGMPLFYFHIYNDEITIDEEGQELPDVDAARRTAVRSVRAVICDGVMDGQVTLSHRIVVEDEERRVVLTILFGDVLRINP